MSRARDLANGTFSGAFSADSPTLVVDDTNNRVGVGTSSPAHELHVASTAGNGNDAYMAILTGGSGGTSANHDLGIYFGSTNQSIRTTYDGSGVAREELIFRTAGNQTMHIDNGGRVTMPYQPAFRVATSSSYSGFGTVILYNTIRQNVGNHYNSSTGRFTAPVSGTYFVSVHAISVYHVTSNEQNLLLRVNGSAISDCRARGYTESNLQVASVVNLNIGDYVDIAIANNNTTTFNSTFHNQFMGFLIG